MFGKNSHNKKSGFVPIQEEFKNTLKLGLDKQREIFKEANTNSDHDIMVKSLENIYNEIISKVKDTHDKKEMNRVTRIINWYYNIPFKYTQKTQHGTKIVLPVKIKIKINQLLNCAYRILLSQLNKNKLL